MNNFIKQKDFSMRNIVRKNKIIIISMNLILILLIMIIKLEVKASTKLEGISNFPNSYQPYLNELSKKHPNWKFTALYTNLDWEYVIREENVFGKNLVPKNYSDSWKNQTPGQYDVEIDGGWVDSSKQAVEYCMDPRNFLNEVRIFQFEGLSYDKDITSLNGVEKILYGTEFYNTKVSYLDSNGNTISTNNTYGDLILKAGQTSNVSPYHLASRIKQEVGPFLTHSSISGTVDGYKGLYNFYNIGATSSSDKMEAIKKGLQYAKDGNGASDEIKKKYLIPWNSKEKSITGGAIFIGSSYINVGQNTIYLQKFDVNDDRGMPLFWHQYMTNVLAPYSESKIIYQGYLKSGILDSSMYFIIPVYENMPQMPAENPDIDKNDFIEDNTNLYCNANNVNVRTGPGTSYDVITTISYPDKLTRIEKGTQKGERWDRVKLENGIIGYVYQTYLTEMQEVEIEKIELSIENNQIKKGETKKLSVKIFPEEASSKEIEFISSNPETIAVDKNGNITGLNSGKAIITVKAKNGNAQSQIEITVFNKVTGISIDQKDINMQLGDSFKINAYVLPEDADNQNIIFSTNNEDIASIDANGTITAKSIGETEIIIKSEENNKIYDKCIVNVVRKMEDSEIHFDSSLKVDSLEISGIDYLNNTVKNIKEKIKTGLKLEFVNNKDEILNDTDFLGTGSKIIVKENNTILREYKIILYGDANGDGKINSVDLLVIQRHILEIEEIEDIYRKASNINKNGKKPTSVDLLLIQRHILGLQIINQ